MSEWHGDNSYFWQTQGHSPPALTTSERDASDCPLGCRAQHCLALNMSAHCEWTLNTRSVSDKQWKVTPRPESKNGQGAPVHAMKACRGSRVIAPLILYFGAPHGCKWLTLSIYNFAPGIGRRYSLYSINISWLVSVTKIFLILIIDRHIRLLAHEAITEELATTSNNHKRKWY
jgi:hypothetical protein